MLNINQFKSSVNKYDLERPNLFLVQFSIPKVFDFAQGPTFKRLAENGRLLSTFCRSANLPGMGLSIAETKRHGIGPSLKMPFSGTSEDLTLTFLNDGDSRTYLFFQRWLGFIYEQSAGRAGGPYYIPGNESFNLFFRKDYESTMDLITLGGEKGKYQGSGILSSLVSVASAKFGVPFVGSLLNSLSGPGFELVERRRLTFVKLYPTYLSGINYSHSASDTVSEFTVNFTYQNYASSYKFS